jgi:hypothetical protein
MPKIWTIEFWLVALPILFVLAGWAAGFQHSIVARYFIPIFAGAWMVLAFAWMLREAVRRLRD